MLSIRFRHVGHLFIAPLYLLVFLETRPQFIQQYIGGESFLSVSHSDRRIEYWISSSIYVRIRNCTVSDSVVVFVLMVY